MTSPTVTATSVGLPAFLPLVGHVVQQLSNRYPRHVDRHLMWMAGAWGLLAAFEHADPDDAGFTRHAVRAIRSHIIDATRTSAQPQRGTVDALDGLADALGIDQVRLRALRDAAVGGCDGADGDAEPVSSTTPAASAASRARLAAAIRSGEAFGAYARSAG